MAQVARKNHTRPRIVEGAADIAQKTEKKILGTGRNVVEGAMRTVDQANHVASECVKACNSNFAACMESGTVASRLFKQLNGTVMESVNQTYSDYLEFSKDALASRDIKALLDAQTKLIHRRMDRLFDRSEKLMEFLFDGYREVMEPLEIQTSTASDQLRRAMAA